MADVRNADPYEAAEVVKVAAEVRNAAGSSGRRSATVGRGGGWWACERRSWRWSSSTRAALSEAAFVSVATWRSDLSTALSRRSFSFWKTEISALSASFAVSDTLIALSSLRSRSDSSWPRRACGGMDAASE